VGTVNLPADTGQPHPDGPAGPDGAGRPDAPARRRLRALGQDRGLIAIAGVAAVSVTWILTELVVGRPLGPLLVLWALQPVGALLATVAVGQASASPGLSRAGSRFWRSLALATGMTGLATIANAYDAMYAMGRPSQQMGPVTAALYSTALLLVIWAMCRLPTGATSRTTRLTILLDASTVVVAAGVYLWTFVGGPAARQQSGNLGPLVAALTITVLPLVVLFGLAKVAQIGRAHV